MQKKKKINYRTFRFKSRMKLIAVGVMLIFFIAGIVRLFLWIVPEEKTTVQSISDKSESDTVVSEESSMSREQATLLEENSDHCFNEQIHQRKEWNLVLVNPEVKLPDEYRQNSKIITAFDREMDSRLKEPYEVLYRAACNDGISLWISSCYRSSELQQELFQEEIDENLKAGMTQAQAESEAEMAVARPGYSEHNTGLAIDFNGVTMDFENSKAFSWLQKNAAEYGFILRYPKGKELITHIMYEPWHYRYVGAEHAKKIKEKGMCLEEYLYYLQENES